MRRCIPSNSGWEGQEPIFEPSEEEIMSRLCITSMDYLRIQGKLDSNISLRNIGKRARFWRKIKVFKSCEYIYIYIYTHIRI